MTVRTARLELRPPSLDDAPAIFEAYASDPEVTRYLGWSTATSVAESRAHVAARLAALAAGETYSWTIRTLEGNRVVGMIEIRIHGDEADVGYALARPYWGRGLMPEALEAVVGFARSALAVTHLWGSCDAANRASARVFEKCGFRRCDPPRDATGRQAIAGESRKTEYFELRLEPN